MANEKLNVEYIQQYDVINRYLHNKLSEKERSDFEVYILEHPEIMDVIEEEKAIGQIFKGSKDYLRGKSASRQEVQKEPYFRQGMRALAIAACVLVAVIFVVDTSNDRSQELIWPLQPPIVLQTVRNGTDNIFSASGAPTVQFRIDMGPPEFLTANTFNLTIKQQLDEKIVYLAGDLRVDDDGWLNTQVTGQTMAFVGLHIVQVSPSGNPLATKDYLIEFR